MILFKKVRHIMAHEGRGLQDAEDVPKVLVSMLIAPSFFLDHSTIELPMAVIARCILKDLQRP